MDPCKTFEGDFFYIETDKKVYYPGETMAISVQLRLSESIERTESLVIIIKGRESFKFTSSAKNERSLKHKRIIVN